MRLGTTRDGPGSWMRVMKPDRASR
jgi:hypothetical protein